MNRTEFSAAARKAIAERSGYHCSFPGCNLPTVGPGASDSETVSTGVAAHICSASPGGPRGQAEIPLSDIGDVANGIWVCASHSRLIDANRGTEFPASLLRLYKSAHESRIAFEQRGYGHACGGVQSLTVDDSAVFVAGTRVDFEKVTIVSGSNAAGKTALCEWIAGCQDVSFLKRWAVRGSNGSRTQVRFCAMTPWPTTWTIAVRDESDIQFEVDGMAVPRLSLQNRFVYVPEPPFRTPGEEPLPYLARWFRADVSLIRSTVRSLAMRGGLRVANPRFVRTEEGEDLLVDVKGTLPGLSFGELSGSEQRSVALELGIELARHETQRNPTMLLADCMHGFDRENFESYVRALASPRVDCQVVLTAVAGRVDFASLSLGGVHFVTLDGCVAGRRAR